MAPGRVRWRTDLGVSGLLDEPGWDASLDACARCGSRKLVKALGEVSCRACGAVGEPGDLVRGAAAGAIRSADRYGPAVGTLAPEMAPELAPETLAPSRDEGLTRAVEEALRRRRYT